ncbi:hypothetical protein ACO0SA_003640 [Hanseniaspora valbyensis]
MPSKETENSNIASELQPAEEQTASAIDAAVEAVSKADGENEATPIEAQEEEEEAVAVVIDTKKDDDENKNEVYDAILQVQDSEDKTKDEAEAAAAAVIADAAKDEVDESEEPPKKKQKVAEDSEDKKEEETAAAATAAIVAPEEEQKEETKTTAEPQVVSAPKEHVIERAVQRKESHKEVERRRRETINTAINELRELCADQLQTVAKPINGATATSATTTSQVTHSKSEVLNAACSYIKDLQNKLKALEMDFENFKSLSKVEMNNVVSAKDALEEALANEKKN